MCLFLITAQISKGYHFDSILELSANLIHVYARRNEFSPEQIYDLRQERARPILEEFKAWMDKRVDQTPAKSLLGKAFSYALAN
jgi:hypothetical protein